MIFVLALLVTVLVVAWVVPSVTSAVTRNVVNAMGDRAAGPGSIDQDLVEARLTRIEEAIDAMALQIERLGDQQRELLPRPAAGDGRAAEGDR